MMRRAGRQIEPDKIAHYICIMQNRWALGVCGSVSSWIRDNSASDPLRLRFIGAFAIICALKDKADRQGGTNGSMGIERR